MSLLALDVKPSYTTFPAHDMDMTMSQNESPQGKNVHPKSICTIKST